MTTFFHGTGFGLDFRCKQKLSELSYTPSAPASHDLIDINWESPTAHSATVSDISSGLHQVSADDYLLGIRDVGHYRITPTTITVLPMADAHEDAVRLFLFGSALGALLHLRGILPLHASAIRLPNDKAVVFCGVSTAGKSTLTAALTQHGYSCLADDIAAIHFDNHGKAWLYPGLPRMKLWSHALQSLDLEGEQRVRPGIDKYFVNHDIHNSCQPVPLHHFYELGVHEECDVRLTPITGMAKISALLSNTYRPAFIDKFGRQSLHMERIAKLAPQLAMKQICRPAHKPTLKQIIDLLEKDWE